MTSCVLNYSMINDIAKLHADISVIELQIDELVYKLDALTPEEIAIVEGRG